MTRPTRLAATAATVGLVAGLIAALGIPRDNGARGGAAAGIASFHGFATAPRVGQARKPRGNDFSTYRLQPGSVHEELRRRDPAGGPDWVVRTYLGRRVTSKRYTRRGVPTVSAVRPCAQLGREVDGQFGWIDGDNVFRPVAPGGQYDTPSDCFSTKIDGTHQPDLSEVTLVASPRGNDPSVPGSAVWGIVGPTPTTVSLTAAGEHVEPARSSRYGVFLEFFGADRSAADATLTTQYPTGGIKHRTLEPASAFMLAHFPHPERYKPTLPETAVVAARAADPGGGPSWGFLAMKATGGYWCQINSGYAVDGRVGNIDARQGVLYEQDLHWFGCARPDFSKYPIQLASSFGSMPGQENLAPARGKLRLQAGRSSFYGLVDPNADLVTISTPRDTRSFVPTGPAHGVIVVYDGAINGRVTITIHMKDGTERRMMENAGL